MSKDSDNISRRSFLRSSAIATGVAATSTSVARGQTDDQKIDFDGWFDNVDNYEGVVDIRGRDEVTIEVGAGHLQFSPPAVLVDPGTTIVWEWVGGRHNVIEENGAFSSELAQERGFTFEQTFEEPGVTKYFCSPHVSAGMKGAIVVDEKQKMSDNLGLGAIIGLIVAVLLAIPLNKIRKDRNDQD